MEFTGLFWFFSWVCAVNLFVEDLLRNFKAPADLDNLDEDIGGGFKHLDKETVLPFECQHELDELKIFIIGEAMVNPKQKELIQVFDDLIYAEIKLHISE